MRFLLLILFFIHFSGIDSFGQTGAVAKSPRLHTFVYVGASWCSYCKLQEAQWENSSKLKEMLNANVYFYKLRADADSLVTIRIADSVLQITSTQWLQRYGKTGHALPCWFMLDENGALKWFKSGVIKQKQLEMLLLAQKP